MGEGAEYGKGSSLDYFGETNSHQCGGKELETGGMEGMKGSQGSNRSLTLRLIKGVTTASAVEGQGSVPAGYFKEG